jgi:hypothetical protein
MSPTAAYFDRLKQAKTGNSAGVEGGEVTIGSCAEPPPGTSQSLAEIFRKPPLECTDSDNAAIVAYFQLQRAEGRIKTPEPAPPKAPKRPRRKTAPARQDDLFTEDAT